MPRQSNDVASLLERRMQVIGNLSEETAEQLRILQLKSGTQVLSMKAPEDSETDACRQDAETALAACQKRIDALEQTLAGIDEEIASATHKED